MAGGKAVFRRPDSASKWPRFLLAATLRAMADAARTILHADMDAFFAAIEQRDRPELRGKPVIIGGSGPRQVVATASYEARAFGVHSAMPGVRAKQLCPHGIFVRPRMEAYAKASQQVQEVFARYTDRIEPLSLDEAFLDVTGCEPLFGDGRSIAAQIKRDVHSATGLTVSVGVASCKFVAKVASDLHKPDGLVVVCAGDERAFLRPLPVSRLWGIGSKTEPQLHAQGLHTIADVQARSEAQLVRDFGERLGRHLFVLANGLDTRPVESEREAKSIGHESTFEQDLRTRSEAHEVLLQLSEQVGRRLRRNERSARVVKLKLRLHDFTTCTRQSTVVATQDDLEIYRAAVALLQDSWRGDCGIRLLGVTASSLVPAAMSQQGSLFEARDERAKKVLSAMDAIRDRHGEGAVRRAGGKRATNPFGSD